MICEQIYNVGDMPTLKATFYDKAEPPALANPTTIEFKLKAPNGTVTTATQAAATNPSIGVWLWPIPAPFDAPGTWKFRAAGTGGVVTAEELVIKVAKSSF